MDDTHDFQLPQDADVVRDDFARKIAELWQENDDFPSSVGDRLIMAMRAFLEVSDEISSEKTHTKEELDLLRVRARGLNNTIKELVLEFNHERGRRHTVGVATTIPDISVSHTKASTAYDNVNDESL